MQVLWTKDKKPGAFKRTNQTYSKVSRDAIETRSILKGDIKAIVEQLPEGVWIAGGWFETLFRGEQPKDLDVFFQDYDAAEEFIDLLQHREESPEEGALEGYQLPKKELFEALLEDDKTTAITIKHNTKPTIQLIRTRYYASAEEVIDSFDFTVCQFAIGKDGLTFNPLAMIDMARKRLVCHQITFTSSTQRRLIKYAKKDYYACGGSLIDMVEKIQNVEESEDIAVLYVD